MFIPNFGGLPVYSHKSPSRLTFFVRNRRSVLGTRASAVLQPRFLDTRQASEVHKRRTAGNHPRETRNRRSRRVRPSRVHPRVRHSGVARNLRVRAARVRRAVPRRAGYSTGHRVLMTILTEKK